jgi:hypothetical protein
VVRARDAFLRSLGAVNSRSVLRRARPFIRRQFRIRVGVNLAHVHIHGVLQKQLATNPHLTLSQYHHEQLLLPKTKIPKARFTFEVQESIFPFKYSHTISQSLTQYSFALMSRTSPIASGNKTPQIDPSNRKTARFSTAKRHAQTYGRRSSRPSSKHNFPLRLTASYPRRTSRSLNSLRPKHHLLLFPERRSRPDRSPRVE